MGSTRWRPTALYVHQPGLKYTWSWSFSMVPSVLEWFPLAYTLFGRKEAKFLAQYSGVSTDKLLFPRDWTCSPSQTCTHFLLRCTKAWLCSEHTSLFLTSGFDLCPSGNVFLFIIWVSFSWHWFLKLLQRPRSEWTHLLWHFYGYSKGTSSVALLPWHLTVQLSWIFFGPPPKKHTKHLSAKTGNHKYA